MSSRGGTNKLENIAMIKSFRHEQYHSLFDNMVPEEIIDNLVQKYWNGNLDYVRNYYEKKKDIN